MIPKEKAEQLISEFEKELLKRQYRVNGIVLKVMSKQCALICVDEMIKQNGELYLNGIDEKYYRKKNGELFELKQEIEKL